MTLDAEDTRMFMSQQFAKERAELHAEVERLKQRLAEAGAYTLSERWDQQQAEIERLRAMLAWINTHCDMVQAAEEKFGPVAKAEKP